MVNDINLQFFQLDENGNTLTVFFLYFLKILQLIIFIFSL